jgi:hypothetical protein
MAPGTSAFYQTDERTGWFVDEVLFYDVGELLSPLVNTASSRGSFGFTPPSPGTYHLAVRPIISGRAWPFGPQKRVVAIRK